MGSNAPRPQPAKCRTCGAAIYWTVTHTGARMPVDAEPIENGNLVLDLVTSERQVGQFVVKPGGLVAHLYGFQHAGRRRYVSHFATCPHATQHRTRKG